MQRLTEGGGRVVSVDGLIPNTATRWGLHDARGHEQPVIERTTRLWLQLGTTGDGTVAVDPDSGEPSDCSTRSACGPRCSTPRA